MAACWQLLPAAVMPDALVSWLQQQLKAALRCHRSVGGGCIHAAWQLELADGRRFFLKTNQASAMPLLEAEADGLAALAALAPDGLQIPAPLACAVVEGQAVLLLTWLDLGRASAEGGWERLGRALAQLHHVSLNSGPGQGRFGWHADNFIGSTPQPNPWHDAWGPFFVQQRLAYQFALAAAAGQPFSQAERLLARAEQWLSAHHPEPVLVHGDLWSGNAAVLSDGGAAIFDPAVHRGDREVDLAMARLFGGFPAAFFSGYASQWPLPAGFEQRIELYNLYHLLNHAHLFGGGYRQQAQQSILRLLV